MGTVMPSYTNEASGAGARLRIRLMSESYLAAMELLLRRLDGSSERGLIFLVLLGAALREVGPSDRSSDPRPVSINGIAQSLGRPFETVRRRLGELETMRVCKRTPNGIVLAIDDDAFDLKAFKTEFNDIIVRLIEDLARFEQPLPPCSDATMEPDAITAAGVELLLAGYEFAAHVHRGWMKMLLYMAVVIANARAIVYDEVLARRYSDNETPPPQRLRLPIGAKALAMLLHLPYTTVRRHLDGLLADGRLVRVEGGMLASDAALVDPAILEANIKLGRRMEVVLAKLAARGFPFDEPSRAYATGRPPLLALH
jgi:hypothetical protein